MKHLPSKLPDEPIEVFRELLSNNNGVAIGDHHGEFAILDFLSENMPKFKEMGVKQLFFEMVRSDCQDLLDNYAKTEETETKFPPRSGERFERTLDWELNVWDGKGGKPEGLKERYLKLFKAANENGIKIIGMDMEHTQNRLEDSNPHWEKIIKDNTANNNPDEKYLVFGGFYHFSHLAAGTEDIKSVNELVGIPSIHMDGSPDDKMHIIYKPDPLHESDVIISLPRIKGQPKYATMDDFAGANIIAELTRKGKQHQLELPKVAVTFGETSNLNSL